MLLDFDRYRAVRIDAVRLLEELPDESVDSFVTDPPYGIRLNLHTVKGRDTRIAGDGKIEARKLWARWVPEAERVARPDTAHLIFAAYNSTWAYDLLASHFDVKGWIVWDKVRMGLGWYLRKQFEVAYFVTKGRPPRRDSGARDVWRFNKLTRLRHPCEKPTDMLRKAVCLTTGPGALVCDPFAGVFSTGVAAIAEGRRFLGGEIDQRYVKVGEGRLAQAVAELSTVEAGVVRQQPQ